MSIERGEIWLANLGPTVGGEIRKTRPVLIVSNNTNNVYNRVVTVLPLTSNTSKIFSFEVLLAEGIANLPRDSKAKADQIRTLDKSRLVKKIGALPSQQMNDVEKAMKIHLGLS
jgi:mRNA interferase MazF